MAPSKPVDKTTEKYFTHHLSKEEMEQGFREGRLVKGVLRVKSSSWQECYVIIQDSRNSNERKSIILSGKSV